MIPSATASNTSTQQYIQHNESMARAAYDKGDYLSGDIHTSAAANAMMIDQSFAGAQASANFSFAVLGALQAFGVEIIKEEFNDLRNWIEFESGAISNTAPEGNHLSVFLLRFFEGESWEFDGRYRQAVLLALIDGNGKYTSVLEGSNILSCGGECNLFQPKPSAKISSQTDEPVDIQKKLWSVEGQQYLKDNGFDRVGGNFQYLLLQHGLQKLSESIR